MSDKFTKEYTMDNVNEFFDNLNNSLNPTLTKFMVWNNYYKEEMRQKECAEIVVGYRNRTGNYYSCNKVTDNIFIVTRHFYDGQKDYYLPCVKKNGILNRYNVAFDTFDQAVIAAYSYLYTGSEDAGHWVCKLMNMLDTDKK